jgi:hypothetical protein
MRLNLFTDFGQIFPPITMAVQEAIYEPMMIALAPGRILAAVIDPFGLELCYRFGHG